MSTELTMIIVAALFIVTILIAVILVIAFSKTNGNGMEKTLTRMVNAVTMAEANIIKNEANIIKNNEEILKETADRTANINKDAVKTMAHAIKEGFSENNKNYCKHCGALIDEDSKFCKHCGKEQ